MQPQGGDAPFCSAHGLSSKGSEIRRLPAITVEHDGAFTGTEPVRILTVSMGARGVENTIERS